MNPAMARVQQCFPYVLVMFPDDENRAALLEVVTEAGNIPLICHSLDEAEKVMRCEDIRTIICGDHIPLATFQGISDLARRQDKRIPLIVASLAGNPDDCLPALRKSVFDRLEPHYCDDEATPGRHSRRQRFTAPRPEPDCGPNSEPRPSIP